MNLFALEAKSGQEQFRSNAAGDVLVTKNGYAAIVTHVDENNEGPVYCGVVIESQHANHVGSKCVILERCVAYRRA